MTDLAPYFTESRVARGTMRVHLSSLHAAFQALAIEAAMPIERLAARIHDRTERP